MFIVVVIVVYAKALVPLEREYMGNFQSAPTNAENHETKNCTHKPIRDVFCRLCHLAVKTVLRHKQHNQMNSGH
jgi:hypothetical protein